MPNRKRGEAHKERVTMLASMPDGFSIQQFAEHFGLKYQQARSIMKYMEGSGLLVKTGPFSGRIFRKVKDVGSYSLDIPYSNPGTHPNGLAGLLVRYS